MMKITISDVLSQHTHQAYKEAQKRASELAVEHNKADAEAFMALMAEIGVGIGDKVTITRTRWAGDVTGTAILTGPKRFSQVKKDGTKSQRDFNVYGPYTVEKLNQPV